MAAARVTMAASRTTSRELEDYSAYAHMSEEQLLQLAIERSLAETNLSPWQDRQVQAHTQPAVPKGAQRPPANPNSANPPSEIKKTKIDRDVQDHIFSKDSDKVIAWTRHNGHLRVTVQTVNDLDPFLSAIWKGDAKTLQDLVHSKSKYLEEPNKDGWLPLHECACNGHVECLKVLLKAKPDTINKRTHRNQTPLILAVGRKHVACVEHLLEQGADPNIANNQWETPLYKACEKGNEEIVELLLRYGATPTKACVQGLTPLHEAVRNKMLESCKMLIHAGAKLWAQNVYGIDSLFTAAQCNAVDVLNYLIHKGGNINSKANDDATALFEASKNGHVQVVKILLSKRADANKANKSGLLPIHIASKNGHESIVAMLIPKTSTTKVRRSGISPLHFAAERNRDDVLEILIEAGYDVNAMLSDDWSKLHEDRRSTALYSAVVNRNIEAAIMLLEAGADPNLDIFNPLLVAVRKGNIEMVTLLVKYGANVNAMLPTHPTSFPAALVFCMRYIMMMKYLLDNGCDALACFKCQYGSNPHPPLKPRSTGRETMYLLNEDPSDYCVQFCEIISAPSVSGLVGPIIDTLLNYVGHVKLCSRLTEHLDNNKDWAHVKEKAVLPCTLMNLCRIKVRQQLGVHRLQQIHTLPLPARLNKFLIYERESFEGILS
ncbi:ankyrin repeat and SOCS box protein 2 isoform X1 [Danio rerio]|uniref:Ankyrin repeat and SOCS box protein 2 n=2 Tax=Danio rerio TaxID=7955 RepID=A0A8M1RFP2_DANRE|nr:ankyrin repeat and SOCS box protein 2-like [Danio rerio]XP_005160665.1 ankyrin repeat and SOCS box protein 2-like [Danio rerio]|eukprot:XP_003200756.1 ankyrin repeat and SOCS box protein 2-like [Danio rerio]